VYTIYDRMSDDKAKQLQALVSARVQGITAAYGWILQCVGSGVDAKIGDLLIDDDGDEQQTGCNKLV